jgi:hypothetical protein
VDEKRRRAIRAQSDDVADRLNEFGSGRSDNGKRRPSRPQGNSRQAILRRLRRDHEPLYELVLDGQLSPHRAAIAAGFRKKPGPRVKRPADQPEPATHAVLQELWLGASHHGSVFETREQLEQAWARHRDEVMRLWARGGHRPRGFWEFETDLEYPGYDREPGFLFQHGLLSAEEREEYLRSADGKNRQQKKEPLSVITEGS